MQLQLIRIKKEEREILTEIKETINFEDGFMLRIVDEFEGGNLYYILDESDFQKICEAERKKRKECYAKGEMPRKKLSYLEK